MIAGIVLFRPVADFLQPQTGKDGFQLALQGEEGLGGAIGAQHQLLGLLRQDLALPGQGGATPER